MLFNFILIAVLASCLYDVRVSSSASVSSYACLLEKYVNLLSFTAECTYSQPYLCSNALDQAKQAGFLYFQVVLRLDFDIDAAYQVDQLMNAIQNKPYSVLYIEPGFKSSTMHTAEYYIESMQKAADQIMGWHPYALIGICSSADDWKKYTLDDHLLSEAYHFLIYYGNEIENFNDYIAFGGWDRPSVKTLGNLQSSCNTAYYFGVM